MTKIDEDEYTELLESIVAMMDDARHEANVSVARGEALPAVALQLASRLQMMVHFAQQHFPSQWRIDVE